MILNTLIQIGESLKEDKVDFDLDQDIIQYINLKYPDPPKSQKILKITVKPEILNFLETLKERIGNIELKDIETGKVAKKEKDEVEEKIIEQIKPDFDVLRECFETELYEYKKEHDYKVLRGNKSGAAVFLSPTPYEKISNKTGIEKLPLWKVKLGLTTHLANPEDDEKFILNFFEYIPNLKEFSSINKDEPLSLVKFVISKLLVAALNSTIKEKYNLKTGMYYMPLCFNGKWPYEFEVFRSYYKSSMSSGDTDTQGICEGCGKNKSLSDGLTGELGFYTIDQKGFSYSFFTKESYQTCDECKINAEKGLNYIKKHQRLYLGDRGKNKNPYQMYVLPIVDESQHMGKVLEEVDLLNRVAVKYDELGGIEIAGSIAKKAKRSKDTDTEKDTVKDIFELIREQVDKEKSECEIKFSLLLVTYYHPEGQASAFHNIISIDFLEYNNIIKLAEGISKLKLDMGEKLSLKDIYYIFGQHKFRKYVSSLFGLKKIDLRQLCQDTYLNLKIDFFKLMAKPESSSTYVRKNLRRLNSYTRLTRSLELL